MAAYEYSPSCRSNQKALYYMADVLPAGFESAVLWLLAKVSTDEELTTYFTTSHMSMTQEVVAHKVLP
jgi:hypothetical protein